jgi:hypothetical protein
MLITFTVKDQKVTHDLGSRTLVAGSIGEVQADFVFDDSWEGYGKVIVFTNSNPCGSAPPLRYDGKALDVPEQALRAGKLYVSVVGFDDNGKRKTTLKWDIQQAITVQECGAMGSCDLLRNLAQVSTGSVSDDTVATDEEVGNMLDDVFGESGSTDEPSESNGTVSEDNVATDEEVDNMLDDIFGSDSDDEQPGQSGNDGQTETPETPETSETPGTSSDGEDTSEPSTSEGDDGDNTATDKEVDDMLDDVFGS